MAAPSLAASPLRASLLQLPAHLRVAAYRQSLSASSTAAASITAPAVRSFSASAARNNAVTELLLTPQTALLDGLHSVGLSWFIVIPTAALLVRSLIVYPLSSVPARKRQKIQTNLSPLITAAVTEAKNKAARDLAKQAPETKRFPSDTPSGRMIHMIIDKTKVYILYQRTMHRIGKGFGAPRFTWRSPLNLLALLSFTEALRLKCGGREGLFSLITTPFRLIAEKIDPERFPPAPPAPTTAQLDELMAQRLEKLRDLDEGQSLTAADSAQLAQPNDLPTWDIDPSATTLADPTLSTEGFSWCLDLTSPDPTLILPITLGLSVALSIFIRRPQLRPSATRTKVALPDAHLLPGKNPMRIPGWNEEFQTRFNRTLAELGPTQQPRFKLTMSDRFTIFIATLFGVGSIYLPTAILLYFIPSVLIGHAQRVYLDWKMPIPRPVMPTRKPFIHQQRRDY